MRSFKRVSSRGFTLIELMIVVAIVGVLAALAIYGVRKYLLNSKTAEVKNALGQMAKDAKTAYEREAMPGQVLAAGTSAAVSNMLCPSSSAKVPSTADAIKGKKYQSDPDPLKDWNKDHATATTPAFGFACLHFTLTDPQYYMYGYTADNAANPATFSATGEGDLNGDGVLSKFEMKGEVRSGTVLVSPNFIETNPEE